LNTEPDLSQPAGAQWIPTDNPWPGSPIYTFGHRNPQGLDFGSVDGGASYILYSSEHGDQSDDEVNIIVPHTNYGWPKVAGLCDDNYTSSLGDSMYLANKSVVSEHGFCDTTHTTLAEPIFSFYNWNRNANKTSGTMGNMHWPTIAPSAIRFYGSGAIPGWNNSLLIPSLKNGLFRLKLKADGLSIDCAVNPSDTMHCLAGYRLRNVTVSPTGDTLFVAVDNSCCTLGASGTIGNSVASPNLGYILRMVYLTTLSLPDSVHKAPPGRSRLARVYPNPAHGELHIDAPAGGLRPWAAQLFSVTGQLLRNETTGSDHITLDIHGLEPGIYLLRLSSAAGAIALIDKVLIE
ncbi:MAG TPA: PQQ-dependent sugar dehydrogenase, partial [Bryobacteraceae bacterium]